MNIGIISNSKISLLSIHALIQSGHRVSIALSEKDENDLQEIESFANQFGIPVTQVNSEALNSEVVMWKQHNSLDFIFVIGFPHILSKELLVNVGVDIINFHYAPLPQHKGAQPAFWLIRNGVKTGGCTAHLMSEKVDSGDIIHYEPYKLGENETYNSYLTKTSALNVQVVHKVIEKIAKENWKKGLKKQNKVLANYHPKPQLKDVRINWSEMGAKQIEQLCRACNPWNKGAIAVLNNEPIKLTEVEVISAGPAEVKAGTIQKLKETDKIVVRCKDGKCLYIKIAYHDDYGYVSNSKLHEIGFREELVLS